MDPDCFAMSSYQFVNSLASCYPQQMNQQQNHVGTPSGGTNTTTSNGGPGAGGGGSGSGGQGSSGPGTPGGNDYFPTAAAYSPNLYPNTPQAHYANQSAYSLGGSGGGTQQNPDMVDYTQLQPQRLLLQQQQQHAHATAQHTAQQQQQPHPQQQHPQQQPTPQQTNISCKYANDPSTPTGNNNNTNASNNNTNTQSLASPQDLSTREISPKLSPTSVVESVARSLNKGVLGGNLVVAAAAANVTNNHGGGGGGVGSAGVNVNVSVNVPMHSPGGGDSDSESDSGNEAGSSQNSGNCKKNPPQIYPWMKRVHLGQSKSTIDNTFSLVLTINMNV
ncbi:homeotic protein Sex combs reduced-like [Rhagoletis pomonella]|uniref:homeotic protein Sex combs reduced-like n=1 Tax=Rhagoletis pomonella TaxID=28610 RepID=UPI00177D90F0|nr:homeotic protein Sex combs reduced-like [Rhagoletis pomonella]